MISKIPFKFVIVKKTNLDYENKRLLAHKHPSQKAKNYLLKEYTKSRKQMKIQSNSVKTSSVGNQYLFILIVISLKLRGFM